MADLVKVMTTEAKKEETEDTLHNLQVKSRQTVHFRLASVSVPSYFLATPGHRGLLITLAD